MVPLTFVGYYAGVVVHSFVLGHKVDEIERLYSFA
jgi:hypothetical protein